MLNLSRDSEPVRLSLSNTAEDRLRRFLRDRIRGINSGLKDIRENKYVKWRKMYEAVPNEPVREFPWHGASNLIVPIGAIHSDTLLARIMAALFKTRPIWTTKFIGDNPELAAGTSNALESFLEYEALEPDELDLYRIAHKWAGEVIRYGTSVLKGRHETIVEDWATPSGDGQGHGWETERTSRLEVEKIPFCDFGIAPGAETVKKADFKYHRIRLERQDLEERSYRGFYNKAAVEKILKLPTRTSPDMVRSTAESDAGTKTVNSYGWAQWDIYECHFKYRYDSKHFPELVVWFHLESDTILRSFFRYYPYETFIEGRLFYRDDLFFGYGFMEMLDQFQEELSEVHNKRLDNRTIANMKMFRADPDSKVFQGYKIYPSATVPANKDEFEAINLGTPSAVDIEDEKLSLELAEKRTGVSGPTQGMGSGTMNKRGVYSSMGTLSLLQEGNTRTDLNVTDMRYGWSRVGRLVCNDAAFFGVDEKLPAFGSLASKIRAAIEAYKEGRIVIPVYAATASVNREVEKQSDILVNTMMSRHFQSIGAMLQAITNPMIPQPIKDFLTKAIRASEFLQRTILLHFGYDEVDKYVPQALPEQEAGRPGAVVPGASAAPAQPSAPGVPSVPGAGVTSQPGSPPTPPIGMPQGQVQ
jgi:hypothetical protein